MRVKPTWTDNYYWSTWGKILLQQINAARKDGANMKIATGQVAWHDGKT